MAKSITFNVKLNVDGKEQLVAATADVKNLREVVRSLDSPMQGLLKDFNNWGFAFQNISSAANGIASSLNSLTAESRAFGGAMAAANTMAGKSGEDFANLKTQVAELSKTIPIARDQLANGLYQVISNGVPEDNWVEYLEKSAKASVGGIANLEEVVKVTSTVIKNYGLAWDDAGTIQDKIQLTAKNGVTSFEQMAQALPRVTANAATLGVSVDELMASFATLTGVSGNTAEVSTQLAAIFTALIKPSSEATTMAEKMGIQFDAAAIKAAGGMKNFLTQLNSDVKSYAATSGMLEQEVYGKLFGSAESLRAITPLVGNLADKFEENVNAMAGSAGTIDGAFKTMGNTGSAQLQKLNNALGKYTDELQRSIGNFLPYINFASQMFTTAASVGTLSSSLAKLGSYIKSTSAAQALCAAVTSRVKAAVTAFNMSLTGTAASATAAKIAIRGMMVATGVGAAIAAVSLIIDKLCGSMDAATAGATSMANAQQQAASKVADAYNGTLQQTYSALMSKYEQLKSSWLSLKSEHEKTEWLKNNKDAFDELKLKVNGISDAENIFSKNTDSVVKAFENRAKAAAYAAQLTELYKQQLDLKTRKDNAQKTIKDVTDKYNHSTSVSNRDNPYAAENAKRQANLAAIAGDMKAGGDGDFRKLDDSLNAVNGKIADTKAAIKSLGGVDGAIMSPSSATSPSTPSATSHSGGGGNGTEKKPALQGSLDWYEEEIRKKQSERNASNDTETTRTLNTEMEGLQRSLYMLKVKVGIETPPPIEVKSQVDTVAEQVESAFEEMQQQLEKNPIHVETDPEGLDKLREKLSDLDNIRSLGNVDLKSFEGVKQSLTAIGDIASPTAKGLGAAGTACSALGTSLQQLGSDSEAAKAGMVMAAIGQIVLSFAQAMTSASSNWVTWLAFGVSGMAQMVSLINTVSGFATGGVVGGSSTTGDKIPIRVNSGEMVLTKTQQARLFAIANGQERPRMMLPDYSLPKLSLNLAALGDLSRQGAETQTVKFRLEGRSLVGALANETRVNSRSGRRSNIKI